MEKDDEAKPLVVTAEEQAFWDAAVIGAAVDQQGAPLRRALTEAAVADALLLERRRRAARS